jgi:transcriptional regulator with XRE-family HTH domain
MSNSTIDTLQENVKRYRKEKGITQLRLSVLTGLSKDYIAAIECKRRVPSIKRLILIATALNTEIYKFFV